MCVIMADFNKYSKGAQQSGNLSGDDLSSVAGGERTELEEWKNQKREEGWTLSTYQLREDGTGYYKYYKRGENEERHWFSVPIYKSSNGKWRVKK